MSKKIKLNLDDLKVQSFVTSLSKAEKSRLKGGSDDLSKDGETVIFCTCIDTCGSGQCSQMSGNCC